MSAFFTGIFSVLTVVALAILVICFFKILFKFLWFKIKLKLLLICIVAVFCLIFGGAGALFI